MSSLELIKGKLGKPYPDLEFLLSCLKEVVEEIDEPELAGYIPWINDPACYENLVFTERHFHLFSISFQLLNLAETNGAVQNRRRQEEAFSFGSVNGLWANSLSVLKEKNVSENEILEKLENILVQPVLTAHPTEAKRPVVLKHYRELYLLLVKRENSMYNSYEQEENKKEIKRVIKQLWFIDEYYLEKPKVDSELDNVLYYFTDVFPEVIRQVNRRLLQAWVYHGFDENKIIERNSFPLVRFGTWIGGDRDGHPFVTPEVTMYALNKLRVNALSVVKKELLNLAEHLSFYFQPEKLTGTLLKRYHEVIAEIGSDSMQLVSAYRNEPFRLFVMLLIEKLPVLWIRDEPIIRKGAYRNSHQLIADLDLLKDALILHDFRFLGTVEVNSVIQIIKTFGFHLAELDIRQNSSYYTRALFQLASSSNEYEFPPNPSDPVIDPFFLKKELAINRPFTRNWIALPEEAVKVLDCFSLLNRHITDYGPYALGSLIVSMTRGAGDLFAVYLLARETGLAFFDETLIIKLQVVPLFETIDDLIGSAAILDEYLSEPMVINSLEYQRKQRNQKEKIQEVMIGYSDSNKDGGILASSLALLNAQKELVRVGGKHGVRIRFFHGKGGTISRGAGPVHWFLRSLPHGTLSGQLKITEQGETIEKKYANQGNARYNLELFLAGNLMNTLLHEKELQVDDEASDILEFMAGESRKHYLALIENEHFMQFFQEATPIDVIEQSNIGSRPSRRTGRRSFSDLRAIPWVFSWGQVRFQLTSWYGVGTTLEKMRDSHPVKFLRLKDLISGNHFIRYLFTNIDTSLAGTDEEIMKMYAGLVVDQLVKNEMMKLLTEELGRTRRLMAELLGRSMEERRKNHYYSTLLRAEAMKVLHRNQVQILKEWRENKDLPEGGNPLQINKLLISVNAIANAMGTTG